MNRKLIYSIQDSSEIDWDDLDEEVQREITDLATDAEYKGITADTPFLVRERIHAELTESTR